MIRFHLVSLFPGFFASPLATGLMARARANGLLDFSFHNPRDFSPNRHRHIDDAPYGGGPGMVIQAQPVVDAARSIPSPGRIISLTPAGRLLSQDLARELARESDVTLLCGRYEGIDARLGAVLPVEEISIGDLVLNGGETAALALIESVARFLPGFLGKEESAENESFASGLLEHPHFTRPEVFEGIAVPEVLLSGNHRQIAAWRRSEALKRTLKTRPDLLDRAPLDKSDAEDLGRYAHTRAGRNLSFCLLHYPVKLGDGKTGVSSLTNLDIHDIARISRSYGMAAFYVLTPLPEQLELLRGILEHWSSSGNQDRARALALVKPVANFAEMEAAATRLHGVLPEFIAASAQWPGAKRAAPPLTPAEALSRCRHGPVVICLGTACGLSRQALAQCGAQLRPLRFLSDNHLPVRSAAAILADRILGDYN